MTKEIDRGSLENYLSSADFLHPNPLLLRNANCNDILVVAGVIQAQNLVVEIETNFAMNQELTASLNNAAAGKLDFSINNQGKLVMISSSSGFFPVAVKAHRIDFDKGVFTRLVLVTDNRNFF